MIFDETKAQEIYGTLIVNVSFKSLICGTITGVCSNPRLKRAPLSKPTTNAS